jgi:hypothetical protein
MKYVNKYVQFAMKLGLYSASGENALPLRIAVESIIKSPVYNIEDVVGVEPSVV